jgi:hypothetical protein
LCPFCLILAPDTPNYGPHAVAGWRRTAYRLAMTPRRPSRRRALLLGAGLLLVVAVGGTALLRRPSNTTPGGPIRRTITWDAVTARLTLTDTTDGRTVRDIPLGELPNPLASQGNATVTMAADVRLGYIYVAQLTRGVIHAYAARDGHELWRASLLPRSFRPDGRTAMQAPVIDEGAGRVVSADLSDGRVILLRARDGHQLAAVPVPPGGLDLAIVRKARRILVFHGGIVDVLDDTSGHRLATVTFGRPYQFGPAHVNQQTGHVFLVNGQGQVALALDGATGHVIPLQQAGAVPAWPAPSFSASPLMRMPPDRWAWIPAIVRSRLPFISPPPRLQPYRVPYAITINGGSGGE